MAKSKTQNLDKSTLARWVILVIIAVTNIFIVKQPLLSLIIFFLPVTWAFLHGRSFFGLRNILIMFAIIMAVGYFGEFLGVHTGKVFGDYFYNANPNVNGFLISGVPPLVTLSYVSMGYTCYMMARIILGSYQKLRGWFLLGVPVLSALFMVMWDLSFDPTSSVVNHLWTWERGGAYFGEPFRNFTGWFLVTGTFFVLISLYLYFFAKAKDYAKPTKKFLVEPVFLFTASAFAIIIREVLPDPTLIQQNMALIALFGMGTVAMVTLLRLATDKTVKSV